MVYQAAPPSLRKQTNDGREFVVVEKDHFGVFVELCHLGSNVPVEEEFAMEFSIRPANDAPGGPHEWSNWQLTSTKRFAFPYEEFDVKVRYNNNEYLMINGFFVN